MKKEKTRWYTEKKSLLARREGCARCCNAMEKNATRHEAIEEREGGGETDMYIKLQTLYERKSGLERGIDK